MNILILGHGFLAHALALEVNRRGWELEANIKPCATLTALDLREMLRFLAPDVVCNCAAYIPESGRVADCDKDKDATIRGNVVFPKLVAEACEMAHVSLIHISTGCIFNEMIEFQEEDTPTRGWDGHCGTYVGSKLLAEKLVLETGCESYILRIRLPFDEISNKRNYFNKLMEFPTVYKHWNSLTHRGEFAKAALDLFEFDSPPGIYHVANQGQISAEEVCEKLMNAGIMKNMPKFVEHQTTGCRLSTRKLSEAGIIMRPVEEAVDDAIKNWRK